MSIHSERARDLFLEGYNCSQAIVGAFCEELGLDTETALKLSSSFGGGMGGLREVCGALSGAFMVAGLLKGYSSPTDKAAKLAHYDLIQKIAERFREEEGTLLCRDLLAKCAIEAKKTPEDRTPEYYRTRPCVAYVEKVALFLDEMLFNREA